VATPSTLSTTALLRHQHRFDWPDGKAWDPRRRSSSQNKVSSGMLRCIGEWQHARDAVSQSRPALPQLCRWEGGWTCLPVQRCPSFPGGRDASSAIACLGSSVPTVCTTVQGESSQRPADPDGLDSHQDKANDFTTGSRNAMSWNSAVNGQKNAPSYVVSA
jgi:hypothetical protein